MEITTIIVAIVALFAGAAISWLIIMQLRKSAYNKMIEDARTEAEALKKDKLVEVKEKYLSLKEEYEKQVQQRNQKLQQRESQIQKREMQQKQEQADLNRKMQENDAVKANLASQMEVVERRQKELERMQQQEQTQLEQISGLSAEEAKNRLVEALKDEAKTNAMSYVNEIMDEARMNANKEAKKVVVQTIQRVATEAAIENSVSVFHIESDEMKGRIIGREGRNIRALEAATGIEIIVDDTPEAIVLSSFDPVRREIARLALHRLVQDGRIHPGSYRGGRGEGTETGRGGNRRDR